MRGYFDIRPDGTKGGVKDFQYCWQGRWGAFVVMTDETGKYGVNELPMLTTKSPFGCVPRHLTDLRKNYPILSFMNQ